MSGFGERLRREREMRGVTLDEISDSTKIGTRSLKALEENDFDKLPGGIFNKGFVRAYSRFLGLDEDQTVADFDAAWKEHQSAAGQPIEPPLPEVGAEPERSPRPVFLAICAILILAAIIAAGWFFFVQRHRIRTSSNSSASIADTQSSDAQPVEAQPTSVTTSGATAAPITSSPVVPHAKSASDSPSAATEETKSKNAIPNGDSSLSNGGSLAKTTVPIQLKVIAHEDSWYSLSADGKDLGQGILSAQKSRNIQAQREVRLKLGNVGGVEISFNGKSVNLDGGPNQVRELTFTAEGLRQ